MLLLFQTVNKSCAQKVSEGRKETVRVSFRVQKEGIYKLSLFVNP